MKINEVYKNDCMGINGISKIHNNSIDLFLSDIPYGISLDDWDVLHKNTNSSLLGSSPAQKNKSGFKKRGKPINGWSSSDRNIGHEYEMWCDSWISKLLPKMKMGSFLFVFGARRTIHHVVNSFEKNGFLLKDLLFWNKKTAHHRAQRISIILNKRGLQKEALEWDGWRLGNLAPICEPIAWFFKPYKIGGTITDNVLENKVGALNIDGTKKNGASGTVLLEYGFRKNEIKTHEAQKPLDLIEYLIELTTIEGQIVLDPFMGSGTTAIASINLKRSFVGFENNLRYYNLCQNRINNYKKRKNEI